MKIGRAMAQERSAFLARLTHDLEQDERIVAAWLGGSFGRGDADELSDIDIHLAIKDDHCADLNQTRRAFVSHFGEPLLIQEAPQNAPPNGAFLLVLYVGQTAPVEVDWSWQPREAALIPERALVLFERSGLPRSSPWQSLSVDDIDRQVSLSTTFF